MSAEARRRTGSDGRRGFWRGRRDTVSASGSICLAVVALWAPHEGRFAWQAWRFKTFIDARRRTGSDGRRGFWGGRCDAFSTSGSICVAGMALWALQGRFAWQAWHFQDLQNVRGSSARNWVGWTPQLLTWQAWHFRRLRLDLPGRPGTLSTSGSICVAGKAL